MIPARSASPGIPADLLPRPVTMSPTRIPASIVAAALLLAAPSHRASAQGTTTTTPGRTITTTTTTTSVAPASVAFVDVTIVPMDRERVLERQTVIVRDGRIAAIGPVASTPVPAGVTRIDARGKFLMPGLAEMHGHVPAQPGAFADATMLLFVANGVTTV